MTSAKPPKAAPDWERIEACYRTGTMSAREIASNHGITEGAIRKRAKKDGWSRDLTEKVRAKADELVRTETVRTEVRAETPTERQTVEVEAQVQARIRLSHRRDISRFRELCLGLLVELEAETSHLELFEQLGEMLRSEDDKGQDKRNDLYMKVISSAGRIDSMKKLSETLKTLVALEREAYGLAQEQKEEGAGTLAALLGQLARSPVPVTANPPEEEDE